jgi:glyoxylase-like metal-dependent hydrolase (beta-lactamase superfamily II)
MGLSVESVVVPPLMECSYVVADQATGQALLIDPGGDLQGLERILERLGAKPTAIFCTHGHIDHVAGVAPAKRRFGVPFLAHPGDRAWIEMLPAQAALLRLTPPEIPQVDRWVADGEQLRLGGAMARIIHTPGHSQGGCCLLFASEKILFTGDTLFAGAIGRTDFTGGSLPMLERSIREKLFTLDDEIVFYPGHGPSQVLGEEKIINPFVGESPRGPRRGQR